jgi:HPt (histidine-containing phosphotransfer) domain-containing protein
MVAPQLFIVCAAAGRRNGVTMADPAVIDNVLAQTSIAGLDIPDALARMGNSGKMYLRIIHSFTTNMPKTLDELAAVTEDTLPDYAIKVHGSKGSCYGIGATACGDLARALEMASKIGDWQTVERDNGAYLNSVRELLAELEKLEANVEAAENQGATKASEASPDPLKLSALLAATQSFDLDQMQKLIDELLSVSYEQGGEVVSYIKDHFDAFDYQAIEEKIIESI